MEHIARAQKMVAAAHAVVSLRVVKGDPDPAVDDAQNASMAGPQGQRPAVAKLPAARYGVGTGE